VFIARLDGSKVVDSYGVFEEFAMTLKFPAYFGWHRPGSKLGARLRSICRPAGVDTIDRLSGAEPADTGEVDLCPRALDTGHAGSTSAMDSTAEYLGIVITPGRESVSDPA
jgi:hypothetical protein